ncbi:MAG: hypothetical protein CL610_25815 [Anaerolineaceae bacterium]|nr:hypothetical protein [Anaerolineaceae bacterium]
MLSAFLLAVYLTALALLLALSIRLWRNLRFLCFAGRPVTDATELPAVSVLVPARNEAHNITACVESLAQQDYPTLEIIVLDDQSTDGTYAQLMALTAKFPALRVMRNTTPPPPGWNGKSYACHLLSAQASGAWLLFTDADTVHTSRSVSSGMSQARRLNVDLLTALPYQRTGSWPEKVMVSFIMDFLPLLGVDLWRMWRRNSEQVLANGQYMLVQAATYRALGGHEAIKGALVDDFALAQHFTRHGATIAFVNGISMLTCRMYGNGREVWHGFSKNMLLALQTNARWPVWKALLFAWGFASLFVLPPLIALLYPNDRWLALLLAGWLLVLRAAVVLHFRRPAHEILTTPLAAVGVMLLGLNTLYLKRRNRPIRWKDRPYSISQ